MPEETISPRSCPIAYSDAEEHAASSEEAGPVDFEINDERVDETGEGCDVSEEPVMKKPFDPAAINIIVRQDTMRNLIERLRNDEIEMDTDAYFQRHPEIWDSTRMSRLIESILIRFPLPAFYFDASNDDKWLIIDGLQRLSSVKKFVVDNALRLHGMEYLTEFEKKRYGDLSRTYTRRIDECPVTLFLVQPDTPDEVKYSIFRRINTGGMTLNNQEIRNAMAKPEIRTFLRRLASDDNFRKTVGDQSKRMLDQELALRFLAFFTMDYRTSGSDNITTFLDRMMRELETKRPEDLDSLERSFRLAMERSWVLFGDKAFEKKTGSTNAHRRKNSTLFEVWTVALARLDDAEMETLAERKDEVREKHDQAMLDAGDYFRSISLSTQKKDYYRIRCETVQRLIQEVIGHA